MFIHRWQSPRPAGIKKVMENTLPCQSQMRQAHVRRDRGYDGVFWVCVHTTGIFCRPSCPARTPQARNVSYVRSVKNALGMGFRPCRRCRPMEANAAAPDWVLKLLALAQRTDDRRLTDQDLRNAGVHPARARRYFKVHFGMTFHDYHRALRMGSALNHLKHGQGALQTAMDCGYASDSGFREAFSRQFGQPPSNGDAIEAIVVRSIATPVGAMQLGATSRGICLVEFADRRALPTELTLLTERLGCPIVPGTNPHVDDMECQLREYFDGVRREFTVPLEIIGTEFQRSVWKELIQIPYGQTCSYAQIAERIDRPGAQRAVGRANGANRIAIVIPCHRVVQCDGGLRGYGGGLWRKQALLDLERGTVESTEQHNRAMTAISG